MGTLEWCAPLKILLFFDFRAGIIPPEFIIFFPVNSTLNFSLSESHVSIQSNVRHSNHVSTKFLLTRIFLGSFSFTTFTSRCQILLFDNQPTTPSTIIQSFIHLINWLTYQSRNPSSIQQLAKYSVRCSRNLPVKNQPISNHKAIQSIINNLSKHQQSAISNQSISAAISNQSFNQSINQSTNQSTNQPIN